MRHAHHIIHVTPPEAPWIKNLPRTPENIHSMGFSRNHAIRRRVSTHHGEVLQDLAHCAHVGVRQELSDAEGEDVLLSPPTTQKTDDNRQEAV